MTPPHWTASEDEAAEGVSEAVGEGGSEEVRLRRGGFGRGGVSHGFGSRLGVDEEGGGRSKEKGASDPLLLGGFGICAGVGGAAGIRGYGVVSGTGIDMVGALVIGAEKGLGGRLGVPEAGVLPGMGVELGPPLPSSQPPANSGRG